MARWLSLKFGTTYNIFMVFVQKQMYGLADTCYCSLCHFRNKNFISLALRSLLIQKTYGEQLTQFLQSLCVLHLCCLSFHYIINCQTQMFTNFKTAPKTCKGAILNSKKCLKMCHLDYFILDPPESSSDNYGEQEPYWPMCSLFLRRIMRVGLLSLVNNHH